MSSARRPGYVTVTFKTKYLWAILMIILAFGTVGPIFASYSGTSSGASSSSGAGSSSPPPAGATPNCSNPCYIHIRNSVFGTGQTYIISKGTQVIWVNNDDTTHTSTSTSGIWDTGVLSPGQSSSPVTFNTDGTFPYICQIHPMSGTIEVVG